MIERSTQEIVTVLSTHRNTHF